MTLILPSLNRFFFLVLVLLNSDVGEITQERRCDIVWWFSPLLNLPCIVLLCLTVFKCRGDSQGRLIFNSRSPLCFFLLFLFLFVFICRGDSQGRVSNFTLVLPSLFFFVFCCFSFVYIRVGEIHRTGEFLTLVLPPMILSLFTFWRFLMFY